MNLPMRTRIIILITSYILVQFIMTPLLFQFMDINTLSVTTSALLLIIALVLFGGFLKEEYQRFKADFDGWGKFILKSIGLYIVLYFLRVLVIILIMNIMDIENLMQNQQALNDLSTSLPFLPMFFIVAIYAPIVEELVFRQSFLGWVDKENQGLLKIMTVISVFVFTFMHGTSIPDFLLYLPLSLVFTRLYFDYNRNIIGSILFHFINNTIAVISMYLLL